MSTTHGSLLGCSIHRDAPSCHGQSNRQHTHTHTHTADQHTTRNNIGESKPTRGKRHEQERTKETATNTVTIKTVDLRVRNAAAISPQWLAQQKTRLLVTADRPFEPDDKTKLTARPCVLLCRPRLVPRRSPLQDTCQHWAGSPDMRSSTPSKATLAIKRISSTRN